MNCYIITDEIALYFQKLICLHAALSWNATPISAEVYNCHIKQKEKNGHIHKIERQNDLRFQTITSKWNKFNMQLDCGFQKRKGKMTSEITQNCIYITTNTSWNMF